DSTRTPPQSTRRPCPAERRAEITSRLQRYHLPMGRARRHQRLLSALAFGLLALVAELVGGSLTRHVDLGRHVQSPSYAGTQYYAILLGVVKGGIALLLAVLLWRLLKARAAERTALRLLGERARRPRLRVTLSPRLTLVFFAVTAVIY